MPVCRFEFWTSRHETREIFCEEKPQSAEICLPGKPYRFSAKMGENLRDTKFVCPADFAGSLRKRAEKPQGA